MKELLEKNQLRTAEITAYSAEGSGIAKIKGCVVFVPGTTRGDKCSVRIVKALSTHAFGIIEEIVTPSPHRVAPECDVFPKCGGCTLRHMAYDEELNFKRQIVEDAMTRIGGFDIAVPPVTPSPKTKGYRNKAQYPVLADENGKISFGFYRARSHDVVPITRCDIQNDDANALANAVCVWANEIKCSKWLRHIFVRTGTGGAQLCIVGQSRSVAKAERLIELCTAACSSLSGIVLNVNKTEGNAVLGEKCITVWGEPLLSDTLLGKAFQLSPLSFYQINHDQAENLYTKAIEFAELDKSMTAVEFYCGSGTITLSLAEKCKSIIGVEIVPEAVADAEENALRNNISNAEFICADAGATAEKLCEMGITPDVIICDPPRKGMDDATIAAILKLAPKRLVYVSCDPATLARDARALAQGGYTPTKIQPLDMFPKTPHVECVLVMAR